MKVLFILCCIVVYCTGWAITAGYFYRCDRLAPGRSAETGMDIFVGFFWPLLVAYFLLTTPFVKLGCFVAYYPTPAERERKRTAQRAAVKRENKAQIEAMEQENKIAGAAPPKPAPPAVYADPHYEVMSLWDEEIKRRFEVIQPPR